MAQHGANCVPPFRPSWRAKFNMIWFVPLKRHDLARHIAGHCGNKIRASVSSVRLASQPTDFHRVRCSSLALRGTRRSKSLSTTQASKTDRYDWWLRPRVVVARLQLLQQQRIYTLCYETAVSLFALGLRVSGTDGRIYRRNRPLRNAR